MASIGDRFALSMDFGNKIRTTAKQDKQEGLKQAAQQFEALFMQRMMKQMRDAIPKSDLLHSQQTDMYQDLLDRQWGLNLAKEGIGLADMLTEQLGETKRTEVVENNGPIGQDRQSTAAYVATKPTEAQPASSALEGISQQMNNLPSYISNFVEKFKQGAVDASEQSGVPAQLIMAQAALETGWGQGEIKRPNGDPSFNLFNIKARAADLSGVSVPTTEYIDGQATAWVDRFKAYPSYDASFADYADLMQRNTRYQPVREAGTPEQAAHQLQASGYATDPNYADKLINIMRQLGTQWLNP